MGLTDLGDGGLIVVLAALYVLGLLSGWFLGRREAPRNPLSGPETAQEALARLTPRGR